MMRRLEGNVLILGVAGKMGVTLALAARKAVELAGVSKTVTGVARFSDPRPKEILADAGVETIVCDLMDRSAVRQLPCVENVVYMVGRKFGTEGDEELTWALNVLVPANVAEHFSASRIVAFSTLCVYPLVTPESGGSAEDDQVDPMGEYAQSCVGRERVLQYFSRRNGTAVCLLRLNYAIDLRYGVLHDIGTRIWNGDPVDVSMPLFNCIWQGDANNHALLALEQCRSPANVLVIGGPESVSVRRVAEELAREMGRQVTFTGEEGATAYLSNTARARELFGEPSVSRKEMVRWTAHWIKAGGSSLNKPTHFEVRDGKF